MFFQNFFCMYLIFVLVLHVLLYLLTIHLGYEIKIPVKINPIFSLPLQIPLGAIKTESINIHDHLYDKECAIYILNNKSLLMFFLQLFYPFCKNTFVYCYYLFLVVSQ